MKKKLERRLYWNLNPPDIIIINLVVYLTKSVRKKKEDTKIAIPRKYQFSTDRPQSKLYFRFTILYKRACTQYEQFGFEEKCLFAKESKIIIRMIKREKNDFQIRISVTYIACKEFRKKLN